MHFKNSILEQTLDSYEYTMYVHIGILYIV